jgi:amino acid adenylation domain-containing protein/non-ribosomal peptide synthase protein (TIGR01720 family)
MLITLLGVLKAGGAYLPVDPEYPAARLEQILTDASPMMVVTTSRQSDRLKTSIPLLYLDSAETKRALDPASVRNPVPADTDPVLLPSHPAYVIYTSGSTGNPKGVVIQHRSTATFVAWAGSVFSSEEWSGVLASTAITFDLSVFEIFATWSWGGTVILAKSVLDLPALPARDRIRLINTVPSAARSLMDSDGLPSGVRTINLAGEALPNSLVQKLYGTGQIDRVFNLYGPSEATTYSTFVQCLRNVHKEPSIGGPIWNTRAYVLNESLEPLPIGVTGLLYVAGDGLARGYLKRPELTAERFVVDPFGAPGARMYLTGDLARWTLEGELEFAGRIDQQVKVRGYRIELGEIEAALAAHSKVSQAAAIVREDQPHGKRIVAYVSPASKEGLDTEELQQHLAQTLPGYMVPAAIVVLDALPLLSNGKLDRKALPAPVWTVDSYRAPRTRVEQALCQIVAEVLSLQRVGLSDNFFTLGGDSILAIQVVSRARKEGFRLTPQDIFRYKTLEALAAMPSALESAVEASTRNTAGIGELIPTPIMRFFFGRGGATQRWSHSTLLKVPEDLRQADLLAALQIVIDTHDVLRLRQDTDLNLFIPPRGSVKAEDCVHCLETFSPEAIHSASRMAQDHLDPKRGIMLQAVWFTSAQRLMLVIHHLSVDGVSWRILIPDLSAAWDAVKHNQPPQLDPVNTPFRVWAARLAELATTSAIEAELPFWESTLSRGAPLVRGLVLDNTLDTIGSASHLQIALPDSMAKALLTTVPAAFYARVDEVLLAALVLALAAWWRENSVPGDRTVLVDLEGHGRDLLGESLDISRTIGWFTAMYPVALSLSGLDLDEALEGGVAAGRAIKLIKDQLRAVPGKGLSYGLLRYLNPQAGPRLAGNPLPQIGFNYLGRFSQSKGEDWALAPEAAALSGMADAQMPLNHLIEIDVRATDTAQGHRLHATLTWAPRHMTEFQVRGLARLWQKSLQAMVRYAGGSSSRWHSSSDFPLVQLTAEQVEHLETIYSGIEDILPLTPLQEGLLFHALYNSGARDAYTIQIGMNIEGALDSLRMQRAVEALLQRHAGLRVVFFHEGLSCAAQIILARVQAPWREMDWSSLTDAEKDRRRSQLKLEERAQRFVLSISPLFRFVLIRLERERYLLLFTVHHILMDGWSAPLFLRELFVLYGSNADAGVLHPVTPYASYLHWLASHDQVSALAVWKEYLAGLDGGTHLVQTQEEIHAPEPQPLCDRTLSPQLTAELHSLARERGLTLNTIIQGLWALLLAKLTSRDDVVFGITVSGRPADLPGIEGTVGLFINTVPLRVRLNPAENFAVLLANIQESQGGLLGIQHVGLAEIQRVSGLGELFDTLLVFENYPKDAHLTKIDFGGIRVPTLESQDSTHYALALVLHTGEQLRFKFQYNPTRIENATVERTADEFMHLLRASMTADDRPWQHLILPGERERRQILYEWNQPPRELPGPACVHGLFEEQVQRTPEAVAVVFGETALTYAELNLRANRLAHYLQQLGVKTESRVAICLERGIEIIVAELGILKAGGTYVPLDPGYPAEHKAMLLSDSGARVIVTKNNMGATDISGMTKVDIEEALSKKVEGEEKGPATVQDGEALAYIMYTSGSTGQPKGVMVPHRAIKRLVINSGYAEWSGERVTFGSNPAFDATTMELWGPLLNGGRVVVIAQETLLDPRKLGAEIKRHRVSVMWMTVGLFNQYVEELKEELSGLRYLIVGGDALDARAMKRMLGGKGPEHLFNGYGPTETTTFALLHEIREIGEKERSIPIGRPIGNTWVYLVNGEMDPVPVGAIGEICIGGEGVGRGYLNRGDLTAEQFVPNPYVEGKGVEARMYRTGDLGRWRPDGTIEFLGRNDHQIKVHGFRVELGEIEARLSECEGVREAVVLAREDASGMKRLVAYYTPEGAAQSESGPGQVEVLRNRLAEKLPRYMVPAAYVRLEKLPLTGNGKIDRKRLPVPEAETYAVCGYEEPIGETEKTLARIWADVLKVERVGRHDNFFALGGHSLLATRLVNSVRSLLGVNLAIQTVFEGQSMAGLAKTVEEIILQEVIQMPETQAVQIAARLSDKH